MVSFSLQAVVEISRLNAFRMSTIWQMVTSHLRMLASLKASRPIALRVLCAMLIVCHAVCVMCSEREYPGRERVRHLRHHPDDSAAHALSAEPAAHGAHGLRGGEHTRPHT